MVHHIAVFSACKKSAKVSVCAFKQIIFLCLSEGGMCCAIFCFLADGRLGLHISTDLQHFSACYLMCRV